MIKIQFSVKKEGKWGMLGVGMPVKQYKVNNEEREKKQKNDDKDKDVQLQKMERRKSDSVACAKMTEGQNVVSSRMKKWKRRKNCWRTEG